MKRQKNKRHRCTKEYVYFIDIPYVDWYGDGDDDMVFFHKLSKAIDYIKEMPMRYQYEIVDYIFKFEVTFRNGESHFRLCNFIYQRNKQGEWYKRKNISLQSYMAEHLDCYLDVYPKLEYED